MGQSTSREEGQCFSEIVASVGCLTFSSYSVEIEQAAGVQALGGTPSSSIGPANLQGAPAPPVRRPPLKQGGLSQLLRPGSTEAAAGNVTAPHIGEAKDKEPLLRRQSFASTAAGSSQGGAPCGLAAPDAGIRTPTRVLSVRSTLSGGGSDGEIFTRAQPYYTPAVPVAPPTPCVAPVSRRGLRKQWKQQWKHDNAVHQQQQQQREQEHRSEQHQQHQQQPPKQPTQPDYTSPYWQHVLHCKEHVHCRTLMAQLLSGTRNV